MNSKKMLLSKRGENLKEVKKDVEQIIRSYSVEFKENLIREIEGLQKIIVDLKDALDFVRKEYKEKTNTIVENYRNERDKCNKAIGNLNKEINELWEEKKKALEPIFEEYRKLDSYKKELNEKENTIIRREEVIVDKSEKLINLQKNLEVKEIFLNEKEIQIVIKENMVNKLIEDTKIDYDKFIEEKTYFEGVRLELINECNRKLQEAKELKELSSNESEQTLKDRQQLEKDKIHLQSQIDNFKKHGKRKD